MILIMWNAKLFTVSPAGMLFLAQDRNLSVTDLRVLLAIISEHDRGVFTKGQNWIAHMLGLDSANVRRACIKMEEHGYIIRQKDTRGAVISIMLSPNIMFSGRRNQEVRRMKESHHDSIKEKRRRYYERLEKDPNDYPNAGKAVWPGLGPGGTDWVYKGDSDGKAQETEGTEGEDR